MNQKDNIHVEIDRCKGCIFDYEKVFISNPHVLIMIKIS